MGRGFRCGWVPKCCGAAGASAAGGQERGARNSSRACGVTRQRLRVVAGPDEKSMALSAPDAIQERTSFGPVPSNSATSGIVNGRAIDTGELRGCSRIGEVDGYFAGG